MGVLGYCLDVGSWEGETEESDQDIEGRTGEEGNRDWETAICSGRLQEKSGDLQERAGKLPDQT